MFWRGDLDVFFLRFKMCVCYVETRKKLTWKPQEWRLGRFVSFLLGDL